MWNSFDASQTMRHVLQLYLHLVQENTLLGRYVHKLRLGNQEITRLNL